MTIPAGAGGDDTGGVWVVLVFPRPFGFSYECADGCRNLSCHVVRKFFFFFVVARHAWSAAEGEAVMWSTALLQACAKGHRGVDDRFAQLASPSASGRYCR